MSIAERPDVDEQPGRVRALHEVGRRAERAVGADRNTSRFSGPMPSAYCAIVFKPASVEHAPRRSTS